MRNAEKLLHYIITYSGKDVHHFIFCLCFSKRKIREIPPELFDVVFVLFCQRSPFLSEASSSYLFDLGDRDKRLRIDRLN